jgi:CheY-like chemotaxis protein
MPLALVLSVGLDSVVLGARSPLLQSEGYIVMSALSVKEAVDIFLTGSFDIVLLDNSLPIKDRDRLTCLIRASGSRIPVVSVAPEYSHADYFADAMLESDPNKLLMGVRRVLLKAAKMSAYDFKTEDKRQRPRDPTDGPKAAPVVRGLESLLPDMPTIGCNHGQAGGKRQLLTMTHEIRREVAAKAARDRWAKQTPLRRFPKELISEP